MMDYLIITFRMLSVMALALLLSLKTGRRQIGEIPVFDFLVVIVLANVIGADIADLDTEHLPTLFAVVLLISLQFIYSKVILKNRRLARHITNDPVVVIENGQMIKGNMDKIKYSIDNILMLLRDKDIFDVSEVEYAIVEATGKLSVLKKTAEQPVTNKDMNLNVGFRGLAKTVIMEGRIFYDNLKTINLDENWVFDKLKEQDIELKDVFYASVNSDSNLYVSRNIARPKEQHEIRH